MLGKMTGDDKSVPAVVPGPAKNTRAAAFRISREQRIADGAPRILHKNRSGDSIPLGSYRIGFPDNVRIEIIHALADSPSTITNAAARSSSWLRLIQAF